MFFQRLFVALFVGILAACSDGQGELVERAERPSSDQAQTATGQGALPPGHPMMNPGQGMGGPMLAPPGPPAAPLQIEGDRATVAGLSFQIDPAWESVPPSSGFRAAQFNLPVAQDDPDRNELVLFQGIGGSAQMNLERWIMQFTQPDGSSSADRATMEEFEVNGMSVYTLEVDGAFADAVSPTMGGGQPQEGFRLLGAIIEGPGGPWQFKMVGPDATIRNAKDSFNAMIHSLTPAHSQQLEAQPY